MTWYGELIACHKLPENTQDYSEQPCLFEIVLAALVVNPEFTELSISGVAVLEPRAESKAFAGIPQQQFKPWPSLFVFPCPFEKRDLCLNCLKGLKRDNLEEGRSGAKRSEAGHGGKRQEARNLTVDPCSDVQRIFRAVLLQILPMVSRRLNERERSLILPGNVYVWEERRESDGESSDNAPDN
ncbi:hypothetical protein B0H13DRAFT_1851078 [Mycena leptocephala]|nr:hypothetical protein B0H13DRAFT_1851078 [Mycena leptocephala]